MVWVKKGNVRLQMSQIATQNSLSPSCSCRLNRISLVIDDHHPSSSFWPLLTIVIYPLLTFNYSEWLSWTIVTIATHEISQSISRINGTRLGEVSESLLFLGPQRPPQGSASPQVPQIESNMSRSWNWGVMVEALSRSNCHAMHLRNWLLLVQQLL